MIVKHTLPNGVRIVAEKIPHVRSVALGIWVGAGSKDENQQNNGISHFIEHMMFKGTEKRSARQLAEAFDAIGGHVNAFTSKEITCYYGKVLDQHFSTALEILTDMFFGSVFAEGEIEKEKKVIVEEIRMVEDTPDDLVHDLLSVASLGNHTLSYPVLGNEETVLRFTREALLEYKKDHYTPDQVVVAVAGNLPDDYYDQIVASFGGFQGKSAVKGTNPLRFVPGVKVRQKPTEQTHLCIGLPGLSIRDSRIYTLVLLNNVLGGNMSSRLFQEIREERGLAYSVYSYHSAHRDGGVFAVYAGTKHGQEEEVCECICQTLEQVKRHGLTADELNKAKEQLKSSLMLGLESTNNRMSRLGRNELLLGRHLSMDEIVDSVERITLNDVNELACELFTSPMSLALISPDGKIPEGFREELA
ncbi:MULTISPECIES: pitrilysin family protein [Thermoactinomyces]|uniref:Insulinase family protein n=1 Tax=Thermoactinomyces daqus TaxID=1329516 RepID=A0A7W1X8X6_9BACL|nr:MULTISPECIES: pitrilysin family protein [Thermoactinomyces]MBA4542298.1 insulinase family protein [Thermoactinomyces daqus]MBH8598251.1 insulinase family protein [Thermoactinomyces sp. CICC 10523]MBH8604374.1 insulinase family protein [Thermoactinomyces sp. CICC 10522]MBH8608511.1 insulinase family protein [Thermoactinomyces sp. CICC 10521]